MRIASLLSLAGLIPAIMLSGCNRSDDASTGLGASVDRLATQAAAPAPPAATAPDAPAAMPVSREPVIYTDPKSASCGAPALASFVGKPDSPGVRDDITATAKAPGGIRFVLPGAAGTTDFRPDRLNVMIDVTGIIRDLRCG